MQENSSLIISDTSVLIIFTRIQLLHLLQQIYGSILITTEVKKEFGLPVPSWIEIRDPKNQEKLHQFLKTLDPGEASSIALAMELENALLIVDEAPARKIALQNNLSVTGTLGTLLEAKKRGLVKSLKPVLNSLKHEGFRVSEALEAKILLLAHE